MKKSFVFIHGIGLGDWVFEEYFSPYYRSKSFDVHTLCLPAHSRSASLSERKMVTMEECIEYVRHYLNRKVDTPYIIIGMSMGGAICQKLLEEKYSHDALQGMVLLSPVPPTNNLIFTLRLCRKLALYAPDALVDFFSERTNRSLIFSPNTLTHYSDKTIASYLDRVSYGFSNIEYEIFFQDLIKTPFTTELPLKIIGGEDDMLFPPEVIRYTAAYYGKHAEILPNLGHMIPVESEYMSAIEAINAFSNEVFL